MSNDLNTSVYRARELLRQAATLLANNASTSAPTPSFCQRGQPSSPNVSTINLGAGPSPGSDQSAIVRRQSVLGELRSAFQPYQQRGNATARRRARVIDRPLKSWVQKFCCLGGPKDRTTPTTSRRILLADNGLGDSLVTAVDGGSSEEVRASICEKFPHLVGVSFELLRGLSGGIGRPLIKLDPTEEVPNVMCIKRLNYRVIYIRPLVSIIETEDINDAVIEISAAPLVGASRVAEQGCSSNVIDSSDENENESLSAATFEDLRETCYRENPGEQLITVYRQEFLIQVMGMFKDPNMNKLKKPKVVFIGEIGLDI